MRKNRHKVFGAKYHVCARTNRGEIVFDDPFNQNMFEHVVRRALKKYSFIYNFEEIMGNHVHMIIEPLDGEDISRIMQWILARFAELYNRTYGIKGHFWYDRFKSKPILTVRYLMNCIKYIIDNPVRAGIVDHPMKYEGSTALKYYVRGDPDDRFTPFNKKIMNMIQAYMEDYDPTKRLTDTQYGFRPQKPGRKKKTRKNK
ncbi:transposase [Candidatus Margulisiibacteriota bacterium]